MTTYILHFQAKAAFVAYHVDAVCANLLQTYKNRVIILSRSCDGNEENRLNHLNVIEIDREHCLMKPGDDLESSIVERLSELHNEHVASTKGLVAGNAEHESV